MINYNGAAAALANPRPQQLQSLQPPPPNPLVNGPSAQNAQATMGQYQQMLAGKQMGIANPNPMQLPAVQPPMPPPMAQMGGPGGMPPGDPRGQFMAAMQQRMGGMPQGMPDQYQQMMAQRGLMPQMGAYGGYQMPQNRMQRGRPQRGGNRMGRKGKRGLMDQSLLQQRPWMGGAPPSF